MLVYSNPGDAYFNNLVKIMPVRFLICKLLFCLLIHIFKLLSRKISILHFPSAHLNSPLLHLNSILHSHLYFFSLFLPFIFLLRICIKFLWLNLLLVHLTDQIILRNICELQMYDYRLRDHFTVLQMFRKRQQKSPLKDGHYLQYITVYCEFLKGM